MAILVTGGAGYIGSHTVMELLQSCNMPDSEVIVIDNLQKGHREAVVGGTFYEGDLRDEEIMRRIFTENDVEAVIHFAADSLVGESVQHPLKYYNNNLVSMLRLLETMNEYDCKKIVFSSSAAVYGAPENTPILESDTTNPTNPYGETKLAVENLLKWADAAYDIKYISLRYFNAAGAHTSGAIGEDHSPETHLIPLVLGVAQGRRDCISIFGDDYPTKDGTCVRDYIHVTDLAFAHIAALGKLRQSAAVSGAFNLGSGTGFSVREVIEVCRQVTGHKIPHMISARREGDPPTLVASNDKAMRELGFVMKYNSLESIVESAWNFHTKYPNGFKDTEVIV